MDLAAAARTLARQAYLNNIGAQLNGGSGEFRTGASPGADNAATGTLVATVTFSGTAFQNAVGLVITANGITGDAAADAAGDFDPTDGYFRAKNSSDGVVGDFTVSENGGGGEVQLDDPTIVANQPVNVPSFTITWV